MKIAVLLKTATGIAIDAADATWRSGRTLAGVMAPFDAHAVEAAVRLREAGIAQDVVLAAIAGAEVLGAVREGLAMGADRAVLLTDPVLESADIMGRSRALAALLGSLQADLYLYCPWSGDVDGTLLWGAAGARLGVPVIAQARRLDVNADCVHAERQVEQGDLSISAKMPCMVELAETINKPRYPTMKGRQLARSKPVDVVALADIGAGSASSSHGGTQILSVQPAPARAQPRMLDDPASAATGVIAFLRERKLI